MAESAYQFEQTSDASAARPNFEISNDHFDILKEIDSGKRRQEGNPIREHSTDPVDFLLITDPFKTADAKSASTDLSARMHDGIRGLEGNVKPLAERRADLFVDNLKRKSLNTSDVDVSGIDKCINNLESDKVVADAVKEIQTQLDDPSNNLTQYELTYDEERNELSLFNKDTGKTSTHVLNVTQEGTEETKETA